MPDVFDQIGSAAAAAPPTAQAQGDVFDHVAAQAQPQPQAQPQGDVFDQLPSAQPAMPAGQDAAYMQAHPGMDPLAVEQAFQQLHGQAAIPQATSAQQFAQARAG